jgi:hypothetical protein
VVDGADAGAQQLRRDDAAQIDPGARARPTPDHVGHGRSRLEPRRHLVAHLERVDGDVRADSRHQVGPRAGEREQGAGALAGRVEFDAAPAAVHRTHGPRLSVAEQHRHTVGTAHRAGYAGLGAEHDVARLTGDIGRLVARHDGARADAVHLGQKEEAPRRNPQSLGAAA